MYVWYEVSQSYMYFQHVKWCVKSIHEATTTTMVIIVNERDFSISGANTILLIYHTRKIALVLLVYKTSDKCATWDASF